MNMFRDITICVLIALGLGLTFTDPVHWTWASVGGPYVVQAVSYLDTARPFSTVIIFALALTLFMTRLKY
jgi:hypothetical protein